MILVVFKFFPNKENRMKWLKNLWNKWFPPYHESNDFKNKLKNLKFGSVVWLSLKDCRFFKASFIIMIIGDGYFGGNALILGPMGSSSIKEGVKIDFKNITYLENTGVNLLDLK